MASSVKFNPHSALTMRHSAHSVRSVHNQKHVIIERSKSVIPSIHVGKESIIGSHISDKQNNNNNGNKPKSEDTNGKETTMFLTAPRRMSQSQIGNMRCATPLEVQDLSEEDLDSFYFDDSDSEDGANSKFDEKKYYHSMCEKDDLLPCSTFLRQLDSPVCDLSSLALTDKDLRPIAVALVNNSKITDLDISENELGKRGIHHIAEALSENVFISHATFSRVGMDVDAVKYLVNGLRTNKTLTHLDLSTNHLDAKSAVHISKLIQDNDFIVDLNLRENDFDDEAGRILANSIASNLTIKKLDLCWNHIRGQGASEIVKAICDNVELLDVDLSWNGLGEEGSTAFGKHLQKNHTLRNLDISNCRINFLHLGHFLKGLISNDTLETLKITGNPFTTDGAIAIVKCIEVSTISALKNLYLEDTPINDEFLVVYEDLRAKKDTIVHHKEPNKKKISCIVRDKKIEDYDPVLLLFEFMRQENFRLLDMFRTFDKNNDNMISREELKDGFMKFALELPEDKLDVLMKKLDADCNDVIDLAELISGRRQAAYARHVASKDTTGRLSKSMQHLKNLVEQARKKQNPQVPSNKPDITGWASAANKALTRQKSLTAIVEIPAAVVEAFKSSINKINE